MEAEIKCIFAEEREKVELEGGQAGGKKPFMPPPLLEFFFFRIFREP